MDVADVIKAARQDWPKPIGLVFAWLAALACGVLARALLPEAVSVGIFLTAGFLVTLAWIVRRRYKRCPQGCFGFVVAISVEDKETYRVFERDFVQNLDRLLRSGQLAGQVWVYQIPEFHLPRTLSEQEAIALRQKTHSGFVLYGQVRTRNEDIRKHYLDLRGLVGHAETSEANKQRLSHEFTELLPQRSIIQEGAELPIFELTSSLSSLVAKYIAGIAGFLSGSLDYAEVMYSDALRIATPMAGQHEVAKKIIERVPLRLAEIAITRARGCYESWRNSRDEDDLLQMARFLEAAPTVAQGLPEWKVLTAIGMVVRAGDNLDEIKRLVEQTPLDDPVTQMNLAFFDVVRGDFKSAARHYRKADELGISLEPIEEVMSFLDWFKEYRSQFSAEVNFALGYIACHLLKDEALAKEYFAAFQATRGQRFDEEEALIVKWLSGVPKAA